MNSDAHIMQPNNIITIACIQLMGGLTGNDPLYFMVNHHLLPVELGVV